MKGYVIILPVLAFLGGLFFAAASYTSADDSIFAGAPPPVIAGQSSIDKLDCADGSSAAWKGEKVLTYDLASDSHADWVEVEMVRAGMKEWNNQGGPYTLVETTNTWGSDIYVGVTGESNPTGYAGVTLVACPSAQVGIVVAVEIILTDGLDPNEVRHVAAHETGHALGLGHSNDTRDLMMPVIPADGRNVCPSNLDINALNSGADLSSVSSTTLAQRPC